MDDATLNDLGRSLEQAAAHARGEIVPGLRVHDSREVDAEAQARGAGAGANSSAGAESAPRGGDPGAAGVTESLPRIASVTRTGPTVLDVTWDDGTSDRIDLAGWIATGGEILAPLKDEAVFATVRLGDYGAWIEWGPADGDLAIDAYHLRMIADEHEG